jgi:hypothetical protein
MAELKRASSKKNVSDGRLRDSDFELKEKLGEGFVHFTARPCSGLPTTSQIIWLCLARREQDNWLRACCQGRQSRGKRPGTEERGLTHVGVQNPIHSEL